MTTEDEKKYPVPAPDPIKDGTRHTFAENGSSEDKPVRPRVEKVRPKPRKDD